MIPKHNSKQSSVPPKCPRLLFGSYSLQEIDEFLRDEDGYKEVTDRYTSERFFID